MKIGFTGTREGMTAAQQRAVLSLFQQHQPLQPLYESFTVHHGDCVGADAEAHDIARTFTNAKLVLHPPTDDRARAFCTGTYSREPKPYLERNRDIVDETDMLIAAPKTATAPASLKGQGTWSTVFYALKKHKPVYVVAPDGSVSQPAAR